MARIAGIDLPKQKRGVIGLTYIFGIGRSSAKNILAEAKIDESKKVQDWDDDDLAKIRTILNDSYKIEGALRSEVQLNIKRLMDIGFLISFAGNVTFKKADNLRESARVVPLEKLLVETDCPYLTPVPFRGKRNEPARVVETAKFLGEFYGVEFEKLANQTTKNFEEFFRIKV